MPPPVVESIVDALRARLAGRPFYCDCCYVVCDADTHAALKWHGKATEYGGVYVKRTSE